MIRRLFERNCSIIHSIIHLLLIFLLEHVVNNISQALRSQIPVQPLCQLKYELLPLLKQCSSKQLIYQVRLYFGIYQVFYLGFIIKVYDALRY